MLDNSKSERLASPASEILESYLKCPGLVRLHFGTQERLIGSLGVKLNLASQQLQVDATIEINEHEALGFIRLEVLNTIGQPINQEIVSLYVGMNDPALVQIVDDIQHL